MIRFFLLLVCSLFAADRTVCLNMIVKDESLVIRRSLASVKDLIDYWVIVDTGSTDGTQDIIKEFLQDIPGELYERPWVNFGHNRNEALQLAKEKSDYLLFIDADELLEGGFDKSQLVLDCYSVPVRISTEPLLTFDRVLLVKSEKDWVWEGVIHEALNCRPAPSHNRLSTVVLSAEFQDGRRSLDPEKYLKDAKTLELALEKEPDNPNYTFYLAQSYLSSNQFDLALKYYKKRSEMQGWQQHTFWSKLAQGDLEVLLKKPAADFIHSFSKAYQIRPSRAEPIFRLADYFFKKEWYILSYLTSKYGVTIPLSNDSIFVERWIYWYGMRALFANSAWKFGRTPDIIAVLNEIIEGENVPEKVKQLAIESKRKQLCKF